MSETNAWEALCVKSNSIVDHEIEIEGQKYLFKLKVLPWTEIEQLRSDCTLIDRTSRRTIFKESEYQEKLLDSIVTEGPFKAEEKKEFIKSLKMDIKDNLILRISQLHSIPQATAKN